MIDFLRGLFARLFANHSIHLVRFGKLLRNADKRIVNNNESVHRKEQFAS